MRDLVRAREDLRGDLMRARHRVGKLLLRHERRFSRAATGRRPTVGGLSASSSTSRSPKRCFGDGVGAIDALVVRRDALERQMEVLVARLAVGAGALPRLRCLRGLDTLSALGLCAEVGDFARFERAGAADELSRSCAVGELDRRQTPPGRDHQVGLEPRPPAAGRGRLALPAYTRMWVASWPVAKRASHRRSSHSPGKRRGAFTANGSGSTQSAASAAPLSPWRWHVSWPGSAGRPRPSTDRQRTDWCGRRCGHGARARAPATQLWAAARRRRPFLDGGPSRRNPVLR